MPPGTSSITVTMATGLRELVAQEALIKGIAMSEVVTRRLAASYRKSEFAVVPRSPPGRRCKVLSQECET